MRIGFVGMGIMGAPMALNLLRAGFDLTVYNRTASKCAPLMSAGAKQAESLPALAASSDIVITMVSDTPDVEAVLFGNGGLAEGLKPYSTFVDMSTIAPSAAVRFAARLRNRTVDYLDAPVSGGETGAKAAKLSIMAGGDRPVFERCLSLFQAMGTSIVHTGPTGSGLKTKLINQIVGALNLLGAAEGVRVCQAAGLDAATTLQAVSSGAAASWMLSNLGPKMASRDYSAGFSIRLQQKDLRLAMEFCRELGIDAPGVALVFELFTRALESGFGECGNQGLIRLWSA